MTRYGQLRKAYEKRASYFKVPCHLCSARHPIRLCPVYRSKTPEERMREALLGNYCGNCLSMAHRTAGCTSNGRCRRCGEKHHTTLHVDEQTKASREPYKSWSVQVEEEERDNLEGALSLYASDIEAEEMGREITERDTYSQPASMVPERSEPLPFRLSDRPEPLPFRLSGGSEPRLFRPLLQHERQQSNRTPHRRRRHRQRPQLANNNTNRRHEAITTSLPRSTPTAADSRGVIATRQLRTPLTFRSGRTGLDPVAGPVLRPMISLSPTAIVKIEAGGRLHLVRALIDVCSPSTVISADLVRDLRLDETRVGSQTGCVVCLRGKHGDNKRIATHAVVTPHFHRVAPSHSLDPAIAAMYTHICLADPKFYVASPVRLVLGADVYADIILNQVLPASFGPLLAQSTIFGFVLSGVSRA
ncbi:uncharacterized protein [Eurosta solidaginis]|uniref:uncharacterized protein n=1 Tax=Eurosta solidaginis TaxID=178769 RepID=UPI00353139E2